MEEKNRAYFTFYRSFFEAIEDLEDENQLLLYRAICNYGLDKKEPNFNSSGLNAFWKLIKPNLDKTWTNYNNGRNKKRIRANLSETEANPSESERHSLKNKDNRIKNKENRIKNKEKEREDDVVVTRPSPPLSLEMRQKEFYNELVPFVQTYDGEIVRAFYYYWSEPTQDGMNMRKDLEKTWNTETRLEKWCRNERSKSTLQRQEEERTERIHEYAAVAAKFRAESEADLASREIDEAI